MITKDKSKICTVLKYKIKIRKTTKYKSEVRMDVDGKQKNNNSSH